jgi:sugar-specific transcriptional regulator TrmB
MCVVISCHNMIEELTKAGLSPREALVYYTLIQYGSSPAHLVAKRVSLDRTVAYHVLKNLERKGLVSYTLKQHKRVYQVTSPDNLLSHVREQTAFIEALIPAIRKVEKVKSSPHEISIYEGRDGLRTYLLDILNAPSFVAYGSTGKIYEIFKYELPHLLEMASKKRLRGKVVAHSSFKNHAMSKIPLVEYRYLTTVESQATTTVYKDKVAITMHAPTPVVIVIRNKVLAQSYRNYFHFLWKHAHPSP